MKFLFLLSVFLIPYSNLILFNSFTYSDLLFVILFSSLLIRKEFYLNSKTKMYFLLLLTFFTSTLISTFFSSNQIESLSRVLQYGYTFFIILPVFLIMVNNRFMLNTTAISLYLSAISILIYTTVIYFYSPELISTFQGRVYSIYENPWIFSLFLIIILPLSFYFFKRTTGFFKLINFFFIINILYMIILSGARSSYLTIIIVVSFILIIKCASFAKNVYLKVVIYSSGILLIILSYSNYKYFLIKLIPIIKIVSLVSAQKLSSLLGDEIDNTRILIYQNGIDSVSNNFVFGIGPGSFSELYGISMHNIFFSIWVENGIIALVSILIIYWMGIVHLIRYNNKFNNYLTTTIIIINLMFLIFMQLNPVLTLRLFWLPIILLITTVVISRNKEEK